MARTYALGREFGLEGTPAIVAANGEMFAGYLPPAELLQELKRHSGSSEGPGAPEKAPTCYRSSSLNLSGLPSHSLHPPGRLSSR